MASRRVGEKVARGLRRRWAQKRKSSWAAVQEVENLDAPFGHVQKSALKIDEELNAVDSFVQKSLIQQELSEKSFFDSLRKGDQTAQAQSAKLQSAVEWVRRFKLQREVEKERRLEAARILREMVSTPNIPSEQDIIVPKPLRAVVKAEKAKFNKDYIADFRLDIEQEKLPVSSMMRHYKVWFSSLAKAIENEKNNPKKGSKGFGDFYPIFSMMPTDVLATTVLQEFLNFTFSSKIGIPFASAATRVGRAVFEECTALNEKFYKDPWRELRWKVAADTGELDSLQLKSRDRIVSPDWGISVHTKIGAKLVELMCTSCFVEVDRRALSQSMKTLPDAIPAFYHTHAIKANQNIGIIVMHQALLKQLNMSQDTETLMALNAPNHRPMVFPPKPWTKPFHGGFLDTSHSIIRMNRGTSEAVKVLHRRGCPEVYEAVSILGNVAWQLNRPIADIAKRVKEEELGVTGLPRPFGPIFDETMAVLAEKKPVPEQDETSTSRSYRKRVYQHSVRVERARRDKQEWDSKRLDFSAKLDLAEFVKDHDQFWFPYSLDFRGRAYPIPPVSHMGDDLARALLKFKEGRRLGERGMYWLKVHMANQMGFDKASFDDRVKWTEERLDEVFSSAREPIDPSDPTKQKWWATADNPWQALATCMELYNACHSENPFDYVSYMPVHQDGSCNGLQHYAALGRDRNGGEKVNLVRGEKPGDVYTAVADKVREFVKEDAKAFDGNEDLDFTTQRLTDEMKAYIAYHMSDQITRKLVKQTVMTSVYGVTYVGARAQIERRLEEINEKNILAKTRDEPHGHIFDIDQIYLVSNYITKMTLQSIGATFRSAKDIQYWLGQLARVSTSVGQPVSWVTPMGLPAIQPYRNASKKNVHTAMQMVIVSEYDDNSPIHKIRQRNAFPPNYVHSIDSTHMLMTARACAKEGINFTAVHDSYWTHAGDTDRMNTILREQFVELHERPLLEELREQFIQRFPQYADAIPPPPLTNDLDIREVLDSPYFFS